MSKWQYFYSIRIEFLGFRYHGWQMQPKLKTVQGMIHKTLLFMLGHELFKTLGCGRTDAKVSAEDFVFELFLMENKDCAYLLDSLNDNLPNDIRVKSVEPVSKEFNIIQQPKIKEYHYYFSFGGKSHPFNAPFVMNFGKYLDVEQMSKGAQIFLGTHNFSRYSCKGTDKTNYKRKIYISTIDKNTRLKGLFIPEQTFIFKVSSSGFLRYQIRLMMGALVNIGKGQMTIEELRETLDNASGPPIKNIAPSSALMLHKVSW